MGSPAPRVHVFSYDEHECRSEDIDDVAGLRDVLASEKTTWVDVQGLGDEALLRRIAEIFELHPLMLEDAVNIPQRAKAVTYDDDMLLVARVPRVGEGTTIEVPQVCIVVGPRFVLTFQERYFGFFDAVRERIRRGNRPIRTKGSGYLAYALLDTLVDHYFPIAERIAQELEDLEEEVVDQPTAASLAALHGYRRQLVVIRRIGWPQREALLGLLREPSPRFPDEVLVFLRGTEAHMSQIMELVDSSRDMVTGLMDIYLSNVSQRTNDVMKILTIMASIFIPLTFVAGIYGMNFEYMPELRDRRAYPVVLGLMVAMASGMLVYFRHRGWIGGDGGGGRSRRRDRADG